MKIYTKTGDKGSTALYGGERVAKDALRVNAYGSVDEINATLGLARAHLQNDELNATLEQLQNALFDVGADLATPSDSKYRKNIVPIDEADIKHLETLIDYYDEGLQPLTNFVLPGGSPSSAALHMARTVTRRAEREVVTLEGQEDVNAQVKVYLNRLSDLLFTLARFATMKEGVSEVSWHVKGRERGTT